MRAAWALAGACLVATAVRADEGVVGSPHDLSALGPGPIHAIDEQEVCIFCHAPHHASGQSPLWNRFDPKTHYRIYQSSTTDARIDQPSGPSKMCLSCHDGAMALGLVASRPPNEPIALTQRTMPPGPSDLTEDLSDDHPIGFRYDRALSNRDRQLKSPESVSRDLPLGAHGEMHCTTCHDPHNNELGNFLRVPEVRSALCVSCHDMLGWDAGSHATSAAPIRGRAVDPREPLRHPTVSDSGCMSCHKIHKASSPEQLLRFDREEDNCLNCHNGSVARTNIATEFRKRSRHPVGLFSGRHEPNEDPRTMRPHVECADCHNPHAAATDLFSEATRDRLVANTAPRTVGPTTRFVSGVDRGGRQVEHARYEYEICLKCHADGVSNRPRDATPRQVTQTNTRLEFQTSNPSFHPVFGSRNNPDVVSLISPLRVGSVIGCGDCHNSDAADGRMSGPSDGPHGSIYEPLLADNYSRDDFTVESPRAYALCYQCHERQSILGNESFSLHNVHVVNGRTPCSACHDAHGISRTQGNDTRHGSLINFDLNIVRPADTGTGSRIVYEDQGRFAGSCTLVCHGVTHIRFNYGR